MGWRLCLKFVPKKWNQISLTQLGVGLVLWNTNSWCFQCFRFQVFHQFIRYFLCVDFSHWPKISGGFGTWRVHPTDGWLRFPGSNGCQGSGAVSHWTTEQGWCWFLPTWYDALSSPRCWGYSTFYPRISGIDNRYNMFFCYGEIANIKKEFAINIRRVGEPSGELPIADGEPRDFAVVL